MTTDAMIAEIGSEWARACEVQRGFMPQPFRQIDTLSYGARCRQARDLGGDCYDFMDLSDNRLAVAIADASGKGLAAALMISNVQSSLRTAALLTGNDAPTVLRTVNLQVHACALADRYATLFYGVFDISTRLLRYVNAGHNPPMLIRADDSTVWLETGGPPVGMFADSAYREGIVQLRRGDLLIAYTDGVIEAVSPSGEEWGLDSLRKTAAAHRDQSAGEIVDAIYTSIDRFSRGCHGDDATVIVVRVR